MNNDVWDSRVILSPSLISVCDFCNLERSIRELERANIEVLHVDILDGHFSPSMPLGLDTVRAIRKITSMQLDVHLMATANDYFVDELLDIGVQQLVFHAETEQHIDNRLNQIKRQGVRAGVALKPATPLCVLDYVIEKCDVVLLMLINPGYASNLSEGQVTYASRKILALRSMIDDRSIATKIEIDGRISTNNISEFGRDKVDIFVAGSTCLNKDDLYASAIKLNDFATKI